MKLAISVGALLSAISSYGVAASEERGEMRSGAPAAESACVDAVNDNVGGNHATVVESERRALRSAVILSAGGKTWDCLASNAGMVENLAVAP